MYAHALCLNMRTKMYLRKKCFVVLENPIDMCMKNKTAMQPKFYKWKH